MKGGVTIEIKISMKKGFYLTRQEITHLIITTLLFFIVMCKINDVIIHYYGLTDIVSTILTPLNEEFFRFLTFIIGGPIIVLFTLFMALVEFGMYITRLYHNFNGWGFWAFAFMRVLCVFAHFFFFWIQFQFYKKAVLHKNYGYLIGGLILATSAHIFWNSTASQYVYNLIK